MHLVFLSLKMNMYLIFITWNIIELKEADGKEFMKTKCNIELCYSYADCNIFPGLFYNLISAFSVSFSNLSIMCSPLR